MTMNCEKCQELVGELVDGALSHEDNLTLTQHLEECLGCAEVRNDLQSIVSFCQSHRGDYSAPPNEKALWLRIRNVIEAETQIPTAVTPRTPASSFWSGWMSRSWELSMPQLVASAAAIVLVVSLATTVGLRRYDDSQGKRPVAQSPSSDPATRVRDRMWQQQQAFNYWNQRVEANKVRWNQQMRDAFDRNARAIDQTVNDRLDELNRNPNDEISEELLNAALNDKLAFLKEFSDL